MKEYRSIILTIYIAIIVIVLFTTTTTSQHIPSTTTIPINTIHDTNSLNINDDNKYQYINYNDIINNNQQQLTTSTYMTTLQSIDPVDPDDLPPQVRITLESSGITGTGATLRFTFLQMPTFTKLQIGYENSTLNTATDGCQLFDYVPLNSFFSPNWDNTRIQNCFNFTSYTYMGKVVINTDNCAYDNVFSFEFFTDDLDTIQSTINPGDIIECYLIIATEHTFADVPVDPGSGDDDGGSTGDDDGGSSGGGDDTNPLIISSLNSQNPHQILTKQAQNDQNINTNTPTDDENHNTVNIIDALNDDSTNPTTTTTPFHTLQTPQNLTIYAPPDVRFQYNLPVSPVQPQAYITAIEFRDFFRHYKQRISVIEIWFLELPPSTSIPIGLYQDQDLEVNLLEDKNMIAIQERVENDHAFNYQCIRHIARLHIPLKSTYTYDPITAPGEGLGSIYPTTTMFLNSAEDTQQTFMCQFLFQGVSPTTNYTFVFGDQIKTNLTRPALDLENKIIQVKHDFEGVVKYPTPEPTPEPTPFEIVQNNDKHGIKINEIKLLQTEPGDGGGDNGATEPPIDPKDYYSYTYLVTFQLPITVYTNQTFKLELDHKSQELFTQMNLIMIPEAISSDFEVFLTDDTNVRTTSPSISRPSYDDTFEYDSDDFTFTPGQVTLRYIRELPREWNIFYSTWSEDKYNPSDTEYPYITPPPTPFDVANTTSQFKLTLLVPVLTSDPSTTIPPNDNKQVGFHLFYHITTTLLRDHSKTRRRMTLEYNISNPIQLDVRPTMDLTTTLPTSETIIANTNATNWEYTITFSMDNTSYPQSAPEYILPEEDTDDYRQFFRRPQFGYLPFAKLMPPDGLYIAGYYTSPIADIDNGHFTPQCKLLLQTQGVDSSTDINDIPMNARSVSDINDENNPDVLLFEPLYTFTQGKYFRVGVPLFDFRNNDIFIIKCTQKLTNGLKTTLRDNSLNASVQLITHPRRWYEDFVDNSFKIKIDYPVDTVVPPQDIMPTYISSRFGFQISSDQMVITIDDYTTYYNVALYLLRNIKYLGTTQLTNTIGLDDVTYPFYNIEKNDIHIIDITQRQEWYNSINHIGLRGLNYETYTPFSSFSIYTPNSPTSTALLFLLSEQYFVNFNIDFAQFENDPSLFQFIPFSTTTNNDSSTPPNTEPNVSSSATATTATWANKRQKSIFKKQQDDTHQNNNNDNDQLPDNINHFRIDILPFGTITDPTPPETTTPTLPQLPVYTYATYPNNLCTPPSGPIIPRVLLSPIHTGCNAAIGQPINIITQCPFDPFSTLGQYSMTMATQYPPQPIILDPNTVVESLYDGLNVTICGQNNIKMREFIHMEEFWGIYDNGTYNIHSYTTTTKTILTFFSMIILMSL